MVVVACLHTVHSNIAIFEAARPSEAVLCHHVRADLLADAALGGLTEDLAARVAGVLHELAEAADVVLLTCSTLGPAVTQVPGSTIPIMRVDAAFAGQATRATGPVVVLCAAPSTLAATQALFRTAASPDVVCDVRLVPGAWQLFQDGGLDAYYRRIAGAADAAFADGARTVALAQASMAPAAALCRLGVPLTSPESGLRAAMEAAG